MISQLDNSFKTEKKKKKEYEDKLIKRYERIEDLTEPESVEKRRKAMQNRKEKVLHFGKKKNEKRITTSTTNKKKREKV